MKKILVVDDAHVFRVKMKELLQKNGYEVILAVDGIEGLNTAIANPDLALILADVNMYREDNLVSDGLTMVEAIRKIDSLKAIPIIMMTTESSDDQKEKGAKLGVIAWSIKTRINEAKLISNIQKIIG